MANSNLAGKDSVLRRAPTTPQRHSRTKLATHVGLGLLGATVVSLTLWSGLLWIVSQVAS